MPTYQFSLQPGECQSFGDMGRVCNRWSKNTAQSTHDYQQGIQNPRRPWGQATCEAQDCYKAGVDKAHSSGAFGRGVKRKGTAGWRIPTILKGPGRFARGVSGAGGDYQKGFGPYHKVIKRTTLPPRFAKRDPRNISRVNYLVTALGRAKTGKTTIGKVTCPDR